MEVKFQSFRSFAISESNSLLTATIIAGNRIANAKSIIIIQSAYQHES